MFIARWNLKEAVSKPLVRRTEIAYKARLREMSWQKSTKSNSYHICSSGVNAADIGEVFKFDRSKEDVLYEIMLKYGDLTDK